MDWNKRLRGARAITFGVAGVLILIAYLISRMRGT